MKVLLCDLIVKIIEKLVVLLLSEFCLFSSFSGPKLNLKGFTGARLFPVCNVPLSLIVDREL